MWKMFHEKNAIEAVALTVRFAEPLSSIATKRALRDLDSAAFSEGFIDKQPLQQIQFELSSENAGVRQTPTVGMLFQHNTIGRDPFGNVAQQLSRQLVLQPEQLVIQLFKYRGWEVEWPGIRKLFALTVRIASEVVPLSSFRLEYLNRFIFEGAVNEGDVGEILQASDFIARQGLAAPDLWHSHAGRFDDIRAESRRLKQVNADLQIVNPPHPAAGNRTLALMLAVERQFTPPGLEVDTSQAEQVLDQYVNCLHDDIHVLFKQLIESKFALENGLPQ